MTERPAGSSGGSVMVGVKVGVSVWVGGGVKVFVDVMVGDGVCTPVCVRVDSIDLPGTHAQRVRKPTARIKAVRGLKDMIVLSVGKSLLFL